LSSAMLGRRIASAHPENRLATATANTARDRNLDVLVMMSFP
jgi:hypothetical protein